MNPDKPWLCPGTVRFCEHHLRPSMRALEFGSGRSTCWFARRVERLISVEYDREWYEKVKNDLLAQRIDNVDYRLITLDHPQSEPERDFYSPLPRYVRVLETVPEGSLDLIVVDGHYRTTCIKQSLSRLKPGGWLLVDDLGRWRDLKQVPVPAEWKLADYSSNGLKHTAVWQVHRSHS